MTHCWQWGSQVASLGESEGSQKHSVDLQKHFFSLILYFQNKISVYGFRKLAGENDCF